MKFNIVLGNHPPHAINTTRDHTLIIKSGLEEAGHIAQLSMNDVFHNEMNVFYDFFESQSPQYFRFLRNAGYDYGLITTEILKDGRMNYRDSEVSSARIHAVQKIARHARFVWVMHEPSLESYRQLSGHNRCWVLPLGYAQGAQELRLLPYSDRDIDFLFFGLLTPHRQSLLKKLASYGFVLRHVYNVPGFIRNSYIERAKINLSLRQDDAWDQPSVGRITYLVSNGCLVIAEQTANGRPYEDYTLATPPEEFIDTCVANLLDPLFPAAAEERSRAFRRDFPMAQMMRRLIHQTLGTAE